MRRSAGVVVVGGGVIGCSVASELARLGADVMLLESREIAHGASGRNHGLVFYPQNPLTDPLYRLSHSMYRELAASTELNISLDEDPLGFIILVSTEDQWAAAEIEAQACATGGVRVERMDREQLRAAEPNVADDTLGGWFIEDGYRLDPRALTMALALGARARGAEVRTHVDVKQILVKDGKATGVVCDDGIVSVDSVVLAGGPWTPKLARSAGVDLPMSGARGWLMLVTPQGHICNHLLESSGWHLMAGDPGPGVITAGGYGEGRLPEPDIGLLIQPSANGNLLLGGSRIPSLRQDPEGSEVAQMIARKAVAAVPALAGAEVREVWSGVRPMSRDGLPILGWAPEVEGLFIATGHGGQGVMLGAGSGRLVAEMITGAEPFTDPAPFAVDREI
ncbi:MAG TPA: FAD-dependent oxidoreductase [Actinomycetota bacterium]|nr:FAD-dependent oxidoreductase [Actinomycetota bacterium]